jgi:hypothetical protein
MRYERIITGKKQAIIAGAVKENKIHKAKNGDS